MTLEYQKELVRLNLLPTHSLPRSALQTALLFLFGLLFLKALSLEYTDLFDPTEARYAAIAMEMVKSNNWVTPSLPSSGAIIPYLGKPPLHFWLTALAYKTFSIEEWTSRLPSFLGAIAILFLVYRFGAKAFGKSVGILSALITFSSMLFFFYSGASVVDMTMTVFVSLGAVYSAAYIFEGRPQRYLLVVAFAAALGFLTKGPIAMVLIGLPTFACCVLRREFRSPKPLILLVCALMFFALVTPWFWMSEQENPGFLEYFIWNENIGRYLFHDYGDRYGGGHVHTRGASWVMAAIAFMPWTFVLFGSIVRKADRSQLLQSLRENPRLLFLLMWAVTPPLFFSLVRQLHIGYLLPSIPPLAILLAFQLSNLKTPFPRIVLRCIPWLTWILSTGIICVGYFLDRDLLGAGLSIATVIGSIFAVYLVVQKTAPIQTHSFTPIATAAISVAAMWFVVIFSMSGFLDREHSTEPALEQFLHETKERNPEIGIVSNNTYSHYWLASAWQSELGLPVRIRFIGFPITTKLPRYMLVETNQLHKLPPEFTADLTKLGEVGRWSWYRNRTVHR